MQIWLHPSVNWMRIVAAILVFASVASCTTLANHRDLYSPQPAPDSREALRERTAATQPEETPAPRPQFR